jgi:hypothetical protein
MDEVGKKTLTIPFGYDSGHTQPILPLFFREDAFIGENLRAKWETE